MMKIIITIAHLLLVSNIFFGQSKQSGKVSQLAVDILTKKAIKVGDTISVRIRNLSSQSRGFTIEAVSLKKSPFYENAVYSAFLNYDSSFFHNLKTTRELSKPRKLPYVLPNYIVNAYEVEGNSEKYFSFIASGTPVQKKVLIKLRITTDIVDDEAETVYSRPVTLFFVPD